MSRRSKKGTKGEERKSGTATRTVLEKPSGPVPEATVESRHGTSSVTRNSRGFSFSEVEGSGIVMLNARRWGLPMDLRRRSALDKNVEALKNWHSKAKQVQRETIGKKIEHELEKAEEEVEKEVKKGAAKARKGAVKAAKEAKKVEKEVEEEVEKVVRPRRDKKEKAKAVKPKQKKTKSKKE